MFEHTRVGGVEKSSSTVSSEQEQIPVLSGLMCRVWTQLASALLADVTINQRNVGIAFLPGSPNALNNGND